MSSGSDSNISGQKRLRVDAATTSSGPESEDSPLAAVSVSVSRDPPVSSPTRLDSEWQPEFTHQCFSKGRVPGQRDPRLRVWYRDPDLHWCGLFTTSSPSYASDRAAPVVDVASLLSLITPPGGIVVQKSSSIDAGWQAVEVAGLQPLASTWTPPGTRVQEYTASGRRFVVHRWDLGSPWAVELHGRMETLAVWLIETASRVDASDPRWGIFAIYAVASDSGACDVGSCSYSFVGYATVYRFTNPLRRERPDALRIAQVVVLPSYQRNGHGSRLLDAVAAYAESADAFEVTVESPCEGMARLRDTHDAGRAFAAAAADSLPLLAFAKILGRGPLAGPPVAGAAEKVPGDAARALPELDAEGAATVRRALRITLAQAHRCHEALLLAVLVQDVAGRAGAADPLSDDDALRPYRLLVKRRIFQCDADIRAIPDADARKAALEKEWQDVLAQHIITCRRLRLMNPSAGASAIAAYEARLAAALAAQEAEGDD